MNWDCLKQSSIVLDLKNTKKKRAIRELIRKSGAFENLSDAASFERSVLERERVMSTGVGRGVAVAHGEAPELPEVCVALGVSTRGIDFEAADAKPVHILFVVANSKPRQGEYLSVLSSLMKLMREDEVRDKVRGCQCSGDVEETLKTALRNIAQSH